MRKMVFIDVDGTMYKAHEDSISQSIKDKLKEASKHVDLFVSTGRCGLALTCLREARQYFKGFVLSNGAHVVYDNIVVDQKFIEKTDLVKLIDEAKKRNSILGLITNDIIYVSKMNEVVDYALTPRDHNSIVEVEDYHYDLDIKYNMAWSFDYIDTINELEKSLPTTFTFFKWGKIGSDIVVDNITKAKGITTLLNYLSQNKEKTIDMSKTYAIGDSGNDIPMFKLVGNPICMGNGTDAAKKEAKYITKTLEDGGLEYALDMIIKGEW